MELTQRKVTEYEKLKQEIEILQAKADKLRKEIVDYTEQEGGKTEVGVYRLTLIPVSRETFDLKAAWDVIGEKTLKPFVKLVEYPRLQVKRQVV